MRDREECNWEYYRAEFPVTENYIYFNHAAVSPLSTRVSKAVAGVSEYFLREGILCLEKVTGRISEVRQAAAEFIGAQSEEIAFIRNTTQGVLLAANGIRWNLGDNVVMPAIEFPANVYPWMGLTSRGIELRMVEPEEGRVSADMLMDVCDDRTRVITVSLVQFSTGYRIDLEKLGRFCREKGIYLFVDAIQALGALEVSVKKWQIDFLSAGGQKWLLAAPGIGIYYCRRELLEELDIPNPGWTGVIDPEEFLDYNYTYRRDATRFEEGCHNFHGL
ncbi:MAG: aminotransferase class V-fold PLP-dependent enzyme, partial [Candidatus Krumholzibacteriota bacterium]|nr:aminotransferase class V-fold PLP-dependent enzyme [Candidatus Krumholzibacteriota bacterium]